MESVAGPMHSVSKCARLRADVVRAAIPALKTLEAGDSLVSAEASLRGRIGHFAKTNPGSSRSQLRYLDAVVGQITDPGRRGG